MLMSASTAERLTDEGLFKDSPVKPAIRLNDTTDIWSARGGSYQEEPSRPFRSASLTAPCTAPRRRRRARCGTDLGLYSITFNNDLDADLESLEAFAEFRAEAPSTGFGYFLEVFNPNFDAADRARDRPHFINDNILRSPRRRARGRPAALPEDRLQRPAGAGGASSFDPSLIVGVLGGGAGTTRDTFELLHQAEKYGARVALFGRKINLAEAPLAIVALDARGGRRRPVAGGGGEGLSRGAAEAAAQAERPLEDDRRSPRPCSSSGEPARHHLRRHSWSTSTS